MNELAIAVVPLGAARALLSESKAARTDEIAAAARTVVDDGIGGFTIDKLEEAYGALAQLLAAEDANAKL